MHTLGLILLGWTLIGLAAAILIGRAAHIMRHDVDAQRNIPTTYRLPETSVPMMDDKPMVLKHTK